MPTPRSDLSTSAVNGKIYAFGGWDGVKYGSAVEEYDPATDTWTGKADMPTPRGHLSTSAVNGRIYAIGGWDGNTYVSTVEEYDPAMDTWTGKADMPTPRRGLSTSAVNGKIFAIGGDYWDGDDSRSCSIVEEYNPIADTWTRRADMPTARSLFSTSAVEGEIYAIGGYGADTWLSTVEEYIPGFAGERVEAEGKLPTTWGETRSR
jgi:N-acetylneuraminic acid mutarotase